MDKKMDTNMSKDNEDQRRHPRQPREEILSIKLISPPAHFTHKGEPVYCSTLDLSASGMQIHVNVELDEDQLVDIWIVLLENRGTFNLTGRVNWVRHQPDDQQPGEWLVGIELLDTSEDSREWLELFPDQETRH